MPRLFIFHRFKARDNLFAPHQYRSLRQVQENFFLMFIMTIHGVVQWFQRIRKMIKVIALDNIRKIMNQMRKIIMFITQMTDQTVRVAALFTKQGYNTSSFIRI